MAKNSPVPSGLKLPVVLLALCLTRALAEPIPDAELAYPPTPARIATLVQSAAPANWGPQVAPLREAALRAYDRGVLSTAESWLLLYRWAELFSATDAQYIPEWMKAVEAAQLVHPNMAQSYTFTGRQLGASLPADTQAWLVGNAAFSREFFTTVTPYDYIPAVFDILQAIRRRDPAKFAAYPSLALALAVVYDNPPPPWWPHQQVTPQSLVRRWPPAADAFAWWTREDAAGHTYHHLNRLGADELKFVVDSVAAFSELEWAQATIDYPLNRLDLAYTSIRYAKNRDVTQNPIWHGADYRLMSILATGGICVDQAYFATEVAKSRGVPSLLFSGPGSNGRHAWFGYLNADQQWRLDVGRYAEQRFVTGIALDPQTWRPLTDHELQFLTERFRLLPAFSQSETHALFASDFLRHGENARAATAARKAVDFEKRNLAAWDLLTAAETALGYDAKKREATLREAVLAFQRYPDLEAAFLKRVTQSLRDRGETSLADAEEASLARKNRSDRNDLSIQQARDTLLRSMSTQSFPEQVKLYNSLVDRYGPKGGVGLYDQIVRVFVEHLARNGEGAEARKALARARDKLDVPQSSQLDQEITALAGKLK